MRELSKEIGISADELELFEYLLEEEGLADATPDEAISRRESQDYIPLSFAQERLWFLDQLQPGDAAYNMPGVAWLEGDLNVAALERSLNEIIRRHEVLRTTFHARGGRAVQVISPSLSLSLPLIDLSQLAHDGSEWGLVGPSIPFSNTPRCHSDALLSERGRPRPPGSKHESPDLSAPESEARKLARAEAETPFDLARGPLLRAKLVRLSETKHVLLVTLHHIVADGWSITLLVQELGVLYAAYSDGEESPLRELEVSYADYAVWQRQWLTGERLEKELRYWREQLSGDLPVLKLPHAQVRRGESRRCGAVATVRIGRELTQSLRELGRREGATLFMTLLAAWQVLLWRLSGERDVVVGTPVAGRGRGELEPLIGFFVNTLVLRTKLEAELSFAELLMRVREVCLEGYAHQEVPFERVVEELSPERELSHNPLFQVLFALQDAPLPHIDLPGLRMRLEGVTSSSTKFDLALEMTDGEDELSGAWQYDTDVFDAATIKRMAAHYQTLLESIATNPRAGIHELSLMNSDEQHALLSEHNATEVAYPTHTLLHELFEQQAVTTPDGVAVISEDVSLTYAELDQRANGLAHHLRSLGLPTEGRVGVLLERSPHLVVALLAVLKAGGTCVPLDPSYPSERQKLILEDSHAHVVLTQEQFVKGISESCAQVVCLDSFVPTNSNSNLVTSTDAANVAYVIYTSGSTGRPKGVMVTHGALCNHMRWMRDAFALNEADVFLQKTPIGFDASVWEFYVPLLAGAKLVMARPGGHQDSSYLVQTIMDHGVTVLQLVPTLLRMLIQEPGFRSCASLRFVFCGGEALSEELATRCRERLPTVRLCNLYGPAESTIDSTYWVSDSSSSSPTVPIGRPVANVRAYVLDQWLRPVPVGVVGELYLDGAGLARGYEGRPDLTAERFLPNPFRDEHGERMYRTGDLVRRLSGGELEFLERVDRQVKVRGSRVELGEVEAALCAHSHVVAAAVVGRDDTSGERRLVAYVVTVDQRENWSAELRRFLKERLPGPIVPSVFVRMESLPVLPSGKVDRRALPAPDRFERSQQADYRPPRTPVEETLCSIWEKLLGREPIGADDDFFELGGHSLLATQLVSRVQEALSVELPVSRIFQTPVLSELAEFVAQKLKHGVQDSETSLRHVSREQPLPLSFAQQRLWFLDQLEPGNPLYNTPGALRLQGTLDVVALEKALSEIVRRHETLRTVFDISQETPVQIISAPRPLAIPLIDLSELNESDREREARRLIREEARHRFHLAHGPLLRATLLRLSEAEHLLLFTMHHIISDGWSASVLASEATTLYATFTGQPADLLEELRWQYVDYAVWQREWLSGETLDAQLDYWRKQFAVLPPVLELPLDHPRPKVRSLRGAFIPAQFTEELTNGLKELSRDEGATLFMTLLAAFQTVLSRYAAQPDVTVGVPIANRSRREFESLIGFFVNTLVLRTNLAGDPTFRELLARVREVSLGAYAHQDVPFEMLVEQLQPVRDAGGTPLFNVLFVFQNAPRVDLELSGLRIDQLDIETGTAKFDLMLSLEESDGRLRGVLEYSTDLFNESTIQRMLGHFETLLEGVVQYTEQRISELPLLKVEEERKLLVEWNNTATEFPRTRCIHDLFHEQATQTPDAVAVVCGRESLTYCELDHASNRLAHFLRRHGVGPESVVAVATERSTKMVVAVLAVLKAGAAYLPLDPEYPHERLSFMLEDTHASVVLTEQHLLERLPAQGVRAICLDTDAESIACESDTNPQTGASSNNLAYVIYTSGSTGRPKAVMMSHRAVCNLVTFQLNSSRPKARTLQFASLNFDVSAQEIFSTWCAGATLVLVDEETRRDAGALLRLLIDERVERLFLPVVALQHLAEACEAEGIVPRDLREVITAGEQLKITPPIERLFAKLDGCRLDNHYGPTETHLATMWRLETAAGEWPRLPPIGGPIANAQVYVLDAHYRLLPPGVVGELYIGGEELARGYFNRPDQTAERFIPNPFSGEAGARMYKTGDLVRHADQGRLVYIGRSDRQVKVRGFRVEVGEIEATLKLHRDVRQAVVTDWALEDGRKVLAAYVVAIAGASATLTGELKGLLRDHLPEYMVPAWFTWMDQLPMLPNGKVDRRALPPPDRTVHIDDYRNARTPVEEVLCGIWEQVLGREGVLADDDFFDLGGHSLLATQLMSRVRHSFRVEVPLRLLFEQPTPARLAQVVEAEMRAGREPLPPVRPRVSGANAPLSFAQQRLWILDKLEPNSANYNLPSALLIEGDLNVAALSQSLNEIMRRHEVLRTTFRADRGRPVQVISPSLHLSLPLIDLSQLPPYDSDGSLEAASILFSSTHRWHADALLSERGRPRPPRSKHESPNSSEAESEARKLARAEAEKPFDLARGPLLRAMLVRLSETKHVLLVTLHHIVADGWSITLLVQELGVLYAAYCSGKESSLRDLEVSYADYAVWQREWLTGERLDKELGYWREQLSGNLPVLKLPHAQVRRGESRRRGAVATVRMGQELTQSLGELGRREGATLFMTLLAAWQVLLWRLTGERDVVVGTPVAGRGRSELEPLIGFFVNTLVLRTKLEAEMNFAELLGRVREVCLEAYAHQEVPFERVVEELRPERELSHNPLFQVLFALQNMPAHELALSDLKLTALEIENPVARFDLALEVSETADELDCRLTYDTDLFDAATITRMAHHFVNLAGSITADPKQSISSVNFLSDAERQQLLVEWNRTHVDFPKDRCINELFEEQVERTPESPAVVFGDVRLSYRELNERANQWAHRLKQFGAGPEKLIGLCVERSAEMIVGLLAILKAGAAYVPLAPDSPSERLRAIVKEAGIELLLTQQKLMEQMPAGIAHLWPLDGDREFVESMKHSVLNSTVVIPTGAGEATAVRQKSLQQTSAGNLAYVIYTSGSTGNPKGVEITHRNLVHSTTARFAYYKEAVRSFVLVSPVFFDSSVAGIFWTLCQGGKLVLPPNDFERDFPGLATLIEDEQASHILCLPMVYSLLLRQAPKQLKSLSSVMVAGEPCPVELPKFHLEMMTSASLYNEYGPTEATVWTTVYKCVPEERVSIPIGRPVPNAQTYVLDDRGQPVPVGVVGEVYIGGEGLARGYLDSPAQTAERFVPHPFSLEPGARLYATGDLARYLTSGDLEYLGRRDHQVKLRGYRIELGEIEMALIEHPAVREAAVIVMDERRVVAYLTVNGPVAPLFYGGGRDDRAPTEEHPLAAEEGITKGDRSHASPTNEELRDFLRNRLPEYMLPSQFVFLDEMPVSANGKLDRSALPAPGASRPTLTAAYAAPQTPLEQTIAEVWQEFLRLETVGVNDVFFELGGHSLLLVLVHEELQRRLGREVPIADLFKYPTVRALAQHLSDTSERKEESSVNRQRASARREAVRARSQTKAVLSTDYADRTDSKKHLL
jgi:amino acid adenylation domain-containing protein